MDYDVIVIGAGLGGLSAGGVLASKGFKTLIIEKSDTVGGCCSSFNAEGYEFDLGASIILVPWVIDRFFQKMGRRTEDYVRLIKNDPLYDYVDVMDGKRYVMPASFEGVAELISKHSPRDAKTFLEFWKKQGPIMDTFSEVVMQTPQGRMGDLFRAFAKYPSVLRSIKYMLKPFKKLMEDLFEDPVTRRLLGTSAAIGGIAPSHQSGVIFWMNYTEHLGVYYPQGGMGALPRGMAQAFCDSGGHLLMGAEVQRVIVEKGKVAGVYLKDGRTITAKAIVSNANSKTLYQNMIGEPDVPRAVIKGLDSYEYSPSVAVGYLGFDTRLPLRAQHMMVLPDLEMQTSTWKSLFGGNLAMGQLVGLISSPTYIDPSLAPEGHSAFSFYALAPSRIRGASWDEAKWQYLESGINMIDSYFVPGIKDHITFKSIATPEDFEKRINLVNGSIATYEMSTLSLAMFRPSNRSRCIKGLYLCGGSTHLMSVPGAVASGIMAADLALEHSGKAA